MSLKKNVTVPTGSASAPTTPIVRDSKRRTYIRDTLDPVLPELAATLPADVQLDGELVARGDGHPDFHRLGRHRRRAFA